VIQVRVEEGDFVYWTSRRGLRRGRVTSVEHQNWNGSRRYRPYRVAAFVEKDGQTEAGRECWVGRYAITRVYDSQGNLKANGGDTCSTG